MSDIKKTQAAYEDAVRRDERIKAQSRMYAVYGSQKVEELSHRDFFELLIKAVENE